MPKEAPLPESTVTHAIQYPLPSDNIKQSSVAAKLVDDIKALAVSADAAVSTAKQGAIDAASTDATNKYGGLPARVTTLEDNTPWRGRIPDGTDLNTLRTPGIWAIASSTAAGTMTNLPLSFSGLVKVWQTAGTNIWTQEFTGSGSLTNPEKYTRITRSTTTWGAWEADRESKGAIPVGANLDTFRSPGSWVITNASDVTGLPSLAGNIYAVLNVVALPSTISALASQTLRVHVADGDYRIFERVALSTTFPTWEEQGATPAPVTVTDAGPYRHEDLVIRARHRRGGTIGTGKATVALRFDHHLVPFRDKVLPLLKKYNLPWAQIVCPDRVNSYSTDLMTWAELQTMVLENGGEVWNHGATHGDATTKAALETEIVGSLATLRTNLPELAIEGWAPPGLADGGYMGASPFKTTAQNTETYAGQLIMGHHSFVAGYSNELYRVLDGQPPIGASHWTVDAATPASIATHLNNAEERDAGFALMLHSNLLDEVDKITTADFEVILADIAARRDAGTLEVVSYSGLWIADARSTGRQDLAPKAARTVSTAVAAAGSHAVTVSSYGRGIQLGATKEIWVKLDASASGTVDIAVTGKPTTTHTVTAGVNTLRRPVTLGLTSGNVTVTVTPSVAATVTGVNCYAI